MKYRSTTRRPAFTLVELMVAAALVVLIMSILAFAFGAATESLTHLKAVGGLAERLRTAQDKLRSDLEAPHFVTGDSPGVLRLSDIRYDLLAPGGTNVTPPLGGYFQIQQGSGINGSIFEGLDSDGNFSTRAANHAIEMTVKREGKTADDLFVADLPPALPAAGGISGATRNNLLAQSLNDSSSNSPTQFISQWARVKWRLGNQQSIDGVTTFSLYRHQRILPPNRFAAAAGDIPLLQDDFAIHTPSSNLIDPTAIQNPSNRAALTEYTQAGSPNRWGDDLVMTNVLSFEVKPAFIGRHHDPLTNAEAVQSSRTTSLNPGIGNPIAAGPGVGLSNGDHPFDDLPTVTDNSALFGQRVFDTWTSQVVGWNTPWQGGANPPNPAAIPFRGRVNAIQIKIRVYDIKAKMTRQATLIVKM